MLDYEWWRLTPHWPDDHNIKPQELQHSNHQWKTKLLFRPSHRIIREDLARGSSTYVISRYRFHREQSEDENAVLHGRREKRSQRAACQGEEEGLERKYRAPRARRTSSLTARRSCMIGSSGGNEWPVAGMRSRGRTRGDALVPIREFPSAGSAGFHRRRAGSRRCRARDGMKFAYGTRHFWGNHCNRTGGEPAIPRGSGNAARSISRFPCCTPPGRPAAERASGISFIRPVTDPTIYPVAVVANLRARCWAGSPWLTPSIHHAPSRTQSCEFQAVARAQVHAPAPAPSSLPPHQSTPMVLSLSLSFSFLPYLSRYLLSSTYPFSLVLSNGNFSYIFISGAELSLRTLLVTLKCRFFNLAASPDAALDSRSRTSKRPREYWCVNILMRVCRTTETFF